MKKIKNLNSAEFDCKVAAFSMDESAEGMSGEIVYVLIALRRSTGRYSDSPDSSDSSRSGPALRSVYWSAPAASMDRSNSLNWLAD